MLLDGAPFLGMYSSTEKPTVYIKDDKRFYIFKHKAKWIVGDNPTTGSGWLMVEDEASSPDEVRQTWAHFDPIENRWRTDGNIRFSAASDSDIRPKKRARKQNSYIRAEVNCMLSDVEGFREQKRRIGDAVPKAPAVTDEDKLVESAERTGDGNLAQQLVQVKDLLSDKPGDEGLMTLKSQIEQLIAFENASKPLCSSAGSSQWTPGSRCMVTWDDGCSYPAVVKEAYDSVARISFLQYGLNDVVDVKYSAISQFDAPSREELDVGTFVWAVWADDGLMYKGRIKQVLYGGFLVHFAEFAQDAEIGQQDLLVREKVSEEGKVQHETQRKEQPALRKTKVGSYTIAGRIRDDSSKVNQDRDLVISPLNNEPSASFFGVMDGHGKLGHEISEFMAKKLAKLIRKEKQMLIKNPRKRLSLLIDEVISQLRSIQGSISAGLSKHARLDASRSGTTAVLGLKMRNKLFTANVGDSRCILCTQIADKGLASILSCERSSSSCGGEADRSHKSQSTIRSRGLDFIVAPLSKDHKPDDPEEKARITQSGGRVASLGGGHPYRVFGNSGALGLAVSRSIGDFALHPHVISTPDVTEHTLRKQDIFAVWASDGVFEYLSNAAVAQLICDTGTLESSNGDLNSAAKRVCKHAKQKWLENTGGSYQDDITCVIAQFNVVAPAPKVKRTGSTASWASVRSTDSGAETEILP